MTVRVGTAFWFGAQPHNGLAAMARFRLSAHLRFDGPFAGNVVVWDAAAILTFVVGRDGQVASGCGGWSL